MVIPASRVIKSWSMSGITTFGTDMVLLLFWGLICACNDLKRFLTGKNMLLWCCLAWDWPDFGGSYIFLPFFLCAGRLTYDEQ